MFNQLKVAVQANFNTMATGDLFYVAIDREKIWNTYLDAFPDDERQSHNCNCCKSFLRQWSGIVSISSDGARSTIWDNIEVEGYTAAVKALSNYIHSLPITDVFLNEFANCGTDKNFDSVKQVTWEHFNIVLPQRFVNRSNIDTVRGEKRTDKETLKRAIAEIPAEATETVLELIDQGSLYRGSEFQPNLKKFRNLQTSLKDAADDDFWAFSVTTPQTVSRIRNTSIGTLLVNLSENMDLDTAVAKFEQVVAPTNYKRPSALVTPKMVEQAKVKLDEMGLTASLDRRFANEADLSAQDILYVDKSSKITDVFGEISKDAQVNPRTFSKTEEVSINDFIEKIIPNSTSIEVLLENRHLPNMVSLLTAVNKESKSLFKWDNLFSWSYTGGITDSIKERVKAAGGNVEGVLRVSLSWFNFDDLDLHVIEPRETYTRSGIEIYYGSPRSSTSGFLDVDMNAGSGRTREAVENIAWTDESKMLEGTYQVYVKSYSKREHIDQGFNIQIEYKGEMFEFSGKTPLNGQSDLVVKFKYSKTGGIVFENNVSSTVSSKDKWGLKTNSFQKVKSIMLSPNYWEKATGNKHFLFFLENAVNDEQPRGFFNEFLKDEFTENRKVFEVLGSKLKVEPTENQLSGVGFSETNRNNIIVKVTGKFTRTLKITF